jgi:GH25 family lysozyme M1 (1,4-beta-N-acetylmuramidase)
VKSLFINENDLYKVEAGQQDEAFETLQVFEEEDIPIAPVTLGVDTASVGGNKDPDWVTAKTKARISFAIIRATWGTYPDPVFARDWPKIKLAGMVRGAYLFLRFPSRKYPKVADSVAQAQAFIKKVGKLDESDLPPALDVEFPGVGRSETGMTAMECLNSVRAAWKTLKEFYGVAPIIYTSARVWKEDLNNLPASDLIESPLWLTPYPFRRGPAVFDARVSKLSPPPVPRHWGDNTNWWIHQYQGDAVGLPGFPTGNVDMNRFNTMLKGASGDRIKWVQRRLRILPNGRFDAAMESALRAFKSRKGLTSDATVDVRTFTHLCWANPASEPTRIQGVHPSRLIFNDGEKHSKNYKTTKGDNKMNTTLGFEAEPFEIEAGTEDFGHEEPRGDFEFYEGSAEDFEQGPVLAQSMQPAKLPLQHSQTQHALHQHRHTHAKFSKGIGALNKYIVKRNGIYHFTLPVQNVTEAASKLGIDPRVASVLLKSLKKKNTRLRAARVTTAELELEDSGSAGQSDMETYWWGIQIWLNESQTQTLINALRTTGAGTGAACAVVDPEPVTKAACAAVAGVATLSGIALQALDSLGGNQGIIIYWPYVGPTWAWHQ